MPVGGGVGLGFGVGVGGGGAACCVNNGTGQSGEAHDLDHSVELLRLPAAKPQSRSLGFTKWFTRAVASVDRVRVCVRVTRLARRSSVMGLETPGHCHV